MSWGMHNYPYEFLRNLQEGGLYKGNWEAASAYDLGGEEEVWREEGKEGKLEDEGREKERGREVGEEWGDLGKEWRKGEIIAIEVKTVLGGAFNEEFSIG